MNSPQGWMLGRTEVLQSVALLDYVANKQTMDCPAVSPARADLDACTARVSRAQRGV
jgi:hypothetical protein